MVRLLFTLVLIPVGMLTGYGLHILFGEKLEAESGSMSSLPWVLQRITLLILNPIAFSTSIWGLRIDSSAIVWLPMMGLSVLVFGFTMGRILARMLHLDGKQAPVFALSTSMLNLGSVGSLVAYLLLGESAYALVPFYKIFEETWFYTVCFPFAAFSAHKDSRRERSGLLGRLLRDPLLIISSASIILGLGLNFSGIARPAIFAKINSVIVPAGTFILLVAIGMKIPKGKTRLSKSVTLAYLGLKIFLMPAFSVLVAFMGGLASLADLTAFRVVLLLSMMPAAFTSLIPPAIYGLDVGFSFKLWMLSNLSLFATLPGLYLLFRFLIH